ncbi:MAG: sensor histidine kinase [Nitrospinae bacterium]|nr:sensor histidine kinase [Nitrospinota bacterium]
MKKRYIFLTSIVLASTLFYLFFSMFSRLQSSIENHIRDEFNKEQQLITERIAFQLKEMFVDDVGRGVLFLRQPFALHKLFEAIDSKDKKDIAFWNEGAKKVFSAFLNSNSIYHYAVYADQNGDEIIKVGRDDNKYLFEKDELPNMRNISDDSIFAETIKLNERQIHMSRVSEDDHMDIKIGTPVYYRSQKRGVIIIEVEMEEVYSILIPVKHGKSSHTMLFTDKGELLFCSRGLTEEQHKGEREYILRNPSSSYTEIPESHGEKDILMAISTLKINSEKWVVAIESTADEVTGQIKRFEEQKQRLMIMLLLAGIVFLSYFLKIHSDRIKAEVRTENEVRTSKKLEAINKELADSKDRLERTNDELSIANERLKNIDRQKTEFLNIIAHDLRTPLTSIRAYTDMLLMYKDKPETIKKVFVEFLDVIRHEGIRLENLVNDYLDLAKIEAGQMIFKSEPVDIKGIINKSLAIFYGEAMEHGINLKSLLSEDIPVINADDGKLRQVISNLLSNAIKYTPKGGTIAISAEKKDKYIEVCVEDTGPGISKEYHERIFEKFVQVQSRNERVKKGTGLGLSIVKYIVEHHDGKVWVESEEGKGAKFFFTLPIR